MPFSYGKFLAKISSARSGTRKPAAGRNADAHEGDTGSIASPLGTDTAAADSLQAQAVHLPDLDGPASELQADMDSAERVEKILTALWSMTDDLARIRAEFHLASPEKSPGTAKTPVPPGGYGMDERAGIVAQIEVIEGTICRVVAVLAQPDTQADEGTDAQAFIRRVDGQRREMLAKTGEALRQLRLQAIQLAAAVHAYRSSLALARSAIEQARR